MNIDYDSDFEIVMKELKDRFGWSNIDTLPDSYKDLLNDTIKALKQVKNNGVSDDVSNRRELLIDFMRSLSDEDIELSIQDIVDRYLNNQ